MKIVVVEDELRTRCGIVNLIKKLNMDYEVVGEAEDGLAGVEVISTLNPDLVIMDVKMPKMDGIEMLQKLRASGRKFRAVILSGYSDFEYAQTAIKIGVSEYLLKPITVEDLENTLKNVKKDIETEKQLQEKQSSFVSPERIFQNLILGNIDDAEKSIVYLYEKYNICQEKDYIAVISYLGSDFSINRDHVKAVIAPMMDNIPGLKYYMIELNVHNELLILMQRPEKFNDLEKYFQNIVLKAIRDENTRNITMGWIQFSNLQNFRSSLKTLRRELKWSIVLGDDILISYPKTQNISTRPVQYPVEVERNAKSAIYSRDIEKLKRSFKDFMDLWCKYLYKPEHIIEVFVKFASSLVNVIKEVDANLYNQINQKEILQRIMDSLSWYEISGVMNEIINRIEQHYKSDDSKAHSLLIKKAVNLIKDNYSNSITLEEISTRLCITPEYLSSLFCREIGENFTTYIKKFRICKAKELLVNTDLKSYEIGIKVGYADPKYFSRVFKEETGFSPGEYQRTYKVS